VTHRTIHIGASFAIVLVAYWTYALLAVPWIEPRPDRRITSDDKPVRAVPQTDDLTGLFPPGAWQYDAKIIDNNGQGKLLWQKYVIRDNGWVDLSPLTVIFMPDETATDPVERWRHAVVVEAPEGANLRFDRPLDLKRGSIGRLIEGKLRGPVLVRSQGRQDNHQDDLVVRTHDVDLSEQRVSTASDVDFQWGPNSGRGREMVIKLLPRLGPRAAEQEGPNIGGIEQFELKHVERLHLDMGSTSDSAANGGPSKPPSGPAIPGMLSAHAAPIEITCRGPFLFHLIHQVATFRDQVDVLRIQPNGPSDHMSCELLSIFFTRPAPKPGAGKPAKSSAPGFDLQPVRVEAQGTPTTLNAPMDHLQVRAEHLKYTLTDGEIYLEDTQEVTLQKDANKIRAPNFRYTPGPPNLPGQFHLLAGGPGTLQGEMADRPGQQLDASWRQQLEVQPQDQNQVISLTGGATLKFQAMGQLDARDIHFWLHESPPDAEGKRSYQPDRLLAKGDVAGSSPQFSCKDLERLEVWFTNAAPLSPAVSDVGVAEAGPPAAYVPSTLKGPLRMPAGAASPAAIASTAASPLIPPGTQDPAATEGRQSHLEISGRLLQARVLLRDREHGDLTEIKVIDNVKLRETQTAQARDLPLLVTGQWLHATDASSLQAKVTVKGEPAHMEGRGMSLTGPNIQIDRGANTLKMDGPGQMERFLDSDLENRPLSRAETVKINWQKGMSFDGIKAHFQDSVNVIGSSQLLLTGSLDVCFQKPISLSKAQPKVPPLVAWLECGDGVFVENRSIDAGQQASYDRFQLKNLRLNNITGDFEGDGPGWLVSVRRGSSQDFFRPGGPLPSPGRTATIRPVSLGPPSHAPSDPKPLTCVHLTFVKSVTGNKIRKDLTFHGRVRTAYAPAQSWTTTLEGDDPRRLGPGAAVLQCEQLTVNDMSPVSGSSSRNLEFTAQDNVVGEGIGPTGTDYTIRSYRATYAEAKDMLVLEGDGRSDAELSTQEGGEGSYLSNHVAMQKFIYYPKTNRTAAFEGVHSLDSQQMNRAPGRPMPPGKKQGS